MIAGQTIKGVYTSATLNTLIGADVFAGEGTVAAGRTGFAVIIQ